MTGLLPAEREGPSSGRPVLVGVSLSTGSPTALRWAAEEATYRHLPLQAVTAWRVPITGAGLGTRPPALPPLSPSELRARAAQELSAAVRAALGDQLDVVCRVEHGGMTKVLLAAARYAEMLVLGPPHPGRTGALLERVRPIQLIYRLPCPVVVIPPATIPED